MTLDSDRHFEDRIEESDHRLLLFSELQPRDNPVCARNFAVWRIKV
jgi:hypothetical protein